MGQALKNRIKQDRFDNPVQEAMLNLLVAADHLRGRVDRVCASYNITSQQYNVLRILKGKHPEGYPRCEISNRMIEKAPDVTRLIDRLEQQGLVERARSEEDRRLSITRITRAGLRLIKSMEPQMEKVYAYFSERVSLRDRRELSRICEGLYGEAE
ncbi:MAG: MarR family transcriptional regulator [Blastocatellia bacterium]|nr:MarR family transcriptional regulator [Blastocatellia bacterium]